MPASEVLRLLDEHAPADEAERRDIEAVVALVREQPEPWSRRTLPLHLTASALVVDPVGRRVLLRWHDKQQRWLQVGGHADPGETEPWEVARREATEETALDDLGPWPGPVPRLAQVAVVDVVAVGDEPAHQHADLRFLMSTGAPHAVPAEVEGVPLRWASVAEAVGVADEGFRRLLDLVEEQLR